MADNSRQPEMKCSTDESQCFSINLSEVQRDFKRLKVDESTPEATTSSSIRSKCDNHLNTNCNYFALKSSPYSPKISCHEKRQSVNGFRRQRPHSLSSIKVRQNSSDVKTMGSKEEESECRVKDTTICSDFSELNLNSDKSVENDNYLYFNKHFKLDSNEWRHRFADIKDKKSTTSSNSSEHNINSKVKTNKVRKMRVKEHKSCARQALCDPSLSPSHPSADASVEELAAYFDDTLYLPRKMSFMAESIYS
ncbi:unnamed protein product [Medioppia subpectinata]|uniref:Oxidative stress-responsive protein 1 n=1 Tax=Medioppia subpectinata TaxID=1979941 RepID=A0A7R9KQ14_9ACAR|nr:unnamed protein product [Medioppia subpectinata]CAG2107696.1 unnamed protein product [Medioppia subpectinata]